MKNKNYEQKDNHVYIKDKQKELNIKNRCQNSLIPTFLLTIFLNQFHSVKQIVSSNCQVEKIYCIYNNNQLIKT